MENIKMILEAIRNIKVEAKEAVVNGDLVRYRELMGDLLALENCLVTETEKLVRQAA